MHLGVEVTESSTNNQHNLSQDGAHRVRWRELNVHVFPVQRTAWTVRNSESRICMFVAASEGGAWEVQFMFIQNLEGRVVRVEMVLRTPVELDLMLDGRAARELAARELAARTDTAPPA